MATKAYLIGQLIAALELAGALKGRDAYLAGCQATNLTIVQGINSLAKLGKMGSVASLMEQFPPEEGFPATLTLMEQGDYALGYNHYKGKHKPEAFSERFEFKLSPSQKEWLLANGGAEKLRELIDKAREKTQIG